MSRMSLKLGVFLNWLRRQPSGLWRLEAKFRGAHISPSVLFVGRPIISVAEGSHFSISAGAVINSSLRANPLACPQPSVLRTLSRGAKLTLGKNVGLSATVMCASHSIEIEEGTIFGAGAMVIDNDFHYPVGEWDWGHDCTTNARPIKIGRGVFVGARAIILKGVTIGDRAIIGAAAIVTKDVPCGAIAAGNPATIRDRSGFQ